MNNLVAEYLKAQAISTRSAQSAARALWKAMSVEERAQVNRLLGGDEIVGF